jgi:lysophospholipase L1-like esterase
MAFVVAAAAAVLVGVVAIAVVFVGSAGREPTGREPSEQAAAREVSPTASPEPITTAPPGQTGAPEAAPRTIPVSVLSDSHAYFAASWWRQTVEANAVEGVSMGAFASQPGAVASTIASGLDEAAAAAPNGFVLVQAGTNDLLSGSVPAQAAVDIQALWAGVLARGSTPVAVLVPPSSEVGAEVIELNRLLADAARLEGIAVLDVYTPVADVDGGWQAGMSDDGKHANLAGATLQAGAVLAQLPGILADSLARLSGDASTDPK